MSTPLPKYVNLPEPVVPHPSLPQQTSPISVPEPTIVTKKKGDGSWTIAFVTLCCCVIICGFAGLTAILMMIPLDPWAGAGITLAGVVIMFLVIVLLLFGMIAIKRRCQREANASVV